jgi:hypothetical protein
MQQRLEGLRARNIILQASLQVPAHFGQNGACTTVCAKITNIEYYSSSCSIQPSKTTQTHRKSHNQYHKAKQSICDIYFLTRCNLLTFHRYVTVVTSEAESDCREEASDSKQFPISSIKRNAVWELNPYGVILFPCMCRQPIYGTRFKPPKQVHKIVGDAVNHDSRERHQPKSFVSCYLPVIKTPSRSEEMLKCLLKG